MGKNILKNKLKKNNVNIFIQDNDYIYNIEFEGKLSNLIDFTNEHNISTVDTQDFFRNFPFWVAFKNS